MPGLATPTRLYFWLGGQRLGVYTIMQAEEDGSTNWWMGATKENLYLGGRRIEPSDRLGSNISGRTLLPYGEELSPTPHTTETKFATYQRDGVSQDYADQRYYTVGWGSFFTADPYMASGGAAVPASWNRMGYVVGDPVNRLDPSGLDYTIPQDGTFDPAHSGNVTAGHTSVTVTASAPVLQAA